MMDTDAGFDERDALGGAPSTPVDEDLMARCETDRDGLTPKQTADCAGQELADQYENEEDGGS